MQSTHAHVAACPSCSYVCITERVHGLQAAGGMVQVLEALRAAGKPAVGHNCGFDVVYLLTQLAGPAPTWAAFQAACAHWFPVRSCVVSLQRALESRTR